jgi:site-specific DNA-adenine methylase
MALEAPFVWPGGKSTVAAEVWSRFGDADCYVEPFFGTGAVLLNRPTPFHGREIVNDFDDMICNFWRSVGRDPEAVAKWADCPVYESEKHARHIWLVKRKRTIREKLEGTVDYYDARAAGYWVWLLSVWIGSGCCSSTGAWAIEKVKGVDRLRKQPRGTQDGEPRISRQMPNLNSQGIRRNNSGFAAQEWLQQLSRRLRDVTVCCGDWSRVCGGKKGSSLGSFTRGGSICGIFLDPPYSDEANRCVVYAHDNLDVAHAVRKWAIEHGDDPQLRIALCGYDGEHKMPKSWSMYKWKATGGYSAFSDDQQSVAKQNAHRERIWFSPHCQVSSRPTFF